MRKNNIWTVARKEFARFFGDRRMVVSTILLPGILIYVIYSFMGSAMGDLFHVDEDYKPSVYTVNLPASAKAMMAEANFEITEIGTEQELSDAKTSITDKESDLVVVFSEDFDAEVAAFESQSGGTAPSVEIFYNSTRTESSSAYNTLYAMLDAYESALTNKFDVNPGETEFDLVSDKDAAGFMVSSLMPMLMMIFLFSGCMSVAPEAIAGEKERGTMATMLVTPMRRHELAAGKIISLAFIALLSGIASTAGTLLSLPNLMGGADTGMSVAVYTMSDYLMLAGVVLSTVLLFVSLISIVSAYAKTIKEAQSAIMPLMILSMVVGVTAMFSGGAKAEPYFYLIPMYNSVQSMAGIFSFDILGINVLITVAVNLLISVACGFVLTRMFNSEKCMFNK